MNIEELPKIEKLSGKANSLKKELKMIEGLTKHLANSKNDEKVGMKLDAMSDFMENGGGLIGAIVNAMKKGGAPEGINCDCPSCNEERLEGNEPITGVRMIIEPSTAIKMLGIVHLEKQSSLTEVIAELEQYGVNVTNAK